ncbi:MAG: DoxX family protein [Parachlamydiales bacterium]
MKWLISIANGLNKLGDIPPLLARLVVAFGLWPKAVYKLGDPEGFGNFLHSLNVPAPHFFAWVTLLVELIGTWLLVVGLFTRIISIPLMVTVLVAIFTVHWHNGFSAGNNGFEIPLYYFVFFFWFFISGPGRISLDALIARKYRQRPPTKMI